MKTKNRIYLPLLVLSILLLLLVSRFIDSSVLNRDNEYAAIIVLELIIFAFPSIIFSRITPQEAGNTLKIKLFGSTKIFLILTSSVLLISGSLLYGLLVNGDAAFESSFTLYKVFTAKKTDAFMGNVFLVIVYALLPSVVEEFSFRGVICSGYEGYSPIFSVIISSLFFGMIHFEIAMLPFYILAGVLLGTVLYASGSIFASITVHFIFNLFFIFASDYAGAFILADNDFALLVFGIVFFVSAFLFCGECKSLYKKKALTAPLSEGIREEKTNPLEILLSPTAVICYLFYFAVVFLK